MRVKEDGIAVYTVEMAVIEAAGGTENVCAKCIEPEDGIDSGSEVTLHLIWSEAELLFCDRCKKRVNENHATKVAKAMADYDLHREHPIFVDSDYRVIDGQRRLDTRKMMDKHPPIQIVAMYHGIRRYK